MRLSAYFIPIIEASTRDFSRLEGQNNDLKNKAKKQALSDVQNIKAIKPSIKNTDSALPMTHQSAIDDSLVLPNLRPHLFSQANRIEPTLTSYSAPVIHPLEKINKESSEGNNEQAKEEKSEINNKQNFFSENAVESASSSITINRYIEKLDEAKNNALHDGWESDDVDNALYAVVAWLDEQAMTQKWAGAASWRLNPLQHHYFSTMHAGVGFFDRLSALKEEAIATKEVFALILIAGFMGQYTHDHDAIHTIKKNIIEQIKQQQNILPLSINGALFPGIQIDKKMHTIAPRWRSSLSVWLVISIPIVLLAALYGALHFSLQPLVDVLTKGASL